jgi:hypothetical protein
MSDALFVRVADIVTRFRSDPILCRNCAAVLAVYSFDVKSHVGLAVDSVMDVLFETTRAEDSTTRELVATTLCNISENEYACRLMIDKAVVNVLSTLSGTTSELIQELCAKTMCNLTCVIDYHERIIEQNILQTLNMIALLRAVSSSTKLLCARSLLNLTMDELNTPALSDAGAIRVFATLSSINCPLTQSTCARGFLVLTGSENRRMEVIQRRNVVQALFNLVRATAAKTRIIAGMAVCNLLACPRAQKAAIKAGGLAVLKIIATMDCEELREATTRVIITMVHNQSLHKILLQEPIVQVLVLITQNANPWTFECAINAFACLSQAESFRIPLAEKGCVAALVGSVITGRVFTPQFAKTICKCICLLSYHSSKIQGMILNGNVLLALHAIHRAGLCGPDTASMMAIILYNFSTVRDVRPFLMSQDAFKLMVRLSAMFSKEFPLTYKAAVVFTDNLGQEPELHEDLMAQGYMKMLRNVVGPLPDTSSLLLAQELPGGAPISLPGLSARSATSPLANTLTTSSNNATMISSTISNTRASFFSSKTSPVGAMSISTLLGESNPLSSVGSVERVSPAKNASFSVSVFDSADMSESDVTHIARSINAMTQTESCRLAMVNGGVLKYIQKLVPNLREQSCLELVSAICNMAASKHCRAALVEQHATELTIALSQVSASPATRAKCSLALGYLSETTKVHNGIVSALLDLSIKEEDVFVTRKQLSADQSRAEQSSTAAAAGTDAANTGDVEKAPKSLKKRLVRLIKEKKAELHIAAHARPTVPAGKANVLSSSFLAHLKEGDSDTIGSLDKDRVTFNRAERLLLFDDYTVYEYETIFYTASVESGGMATKLFHETPLPTIALDRNLEQHDRAQELTKVILPRDPLPKVRGGTSDNELEDVQALSRNMEGLGIEAETDGQSVDDLSSTSASYQSSVLGEALNGSLNINNISNLHHLNLSTAELPHTPHSKAASSRGGVPRDDSEIDHEYYSARGTAATISRVDSKEKERDNYTDRDRDTRDRKSSNSESRDFSDTGNKRGYSSRDVTTINTNSTSASKKPSNIITRKPSSLRDNYSPFLLRKSSSCLRDRDRDFGSELKKSIALSKEALGDLSARSFRGGAGGAGGAGGVGGVGGGAGVGGGESTDGGDRDKTNRTMSHHEVKRELSGGSDWSGNN